MQNPKLLYKYRKFNHETLAIFINKEIYFAQPTSFNDPYDCQLDIRAAYEEVLKKSPQINFKLIEKDVITDKDILKTAGIFCLSEKPDNVQLWSHYAEDHKGLCICFDLSKDDKFVKGANLDKYGSELYGVNEVIYNNDNPYIKLLNEYYFVEEYDSLRSSIIYEGLIHKARGWKYEKEYRILRGTSGVEKCSPQMIKQIIFGIKMEAINKRTLKSLLSENEWKHIKFKQAERKGASFKLKIRDAVENDYV